MRKIFVSLFISIVLCLTLVLPGFASDIKSVNTENLPKIGVTVSDMKGTLDKNNIKATLDGKILAVDDISVSDGTTEWIIMLDTSQSVNVNYFKSAKNAIKALYNSLGDKDTLKLYYFDEKIVQVLDGTETKEEVASKIDGIEYKGMETVFYDAIKELSALSDVSTADCCIPVIFTDGVDTLSSVTYDEANEILSQMKNPVYGFYADNIKTSDAAALNKLLSASKGSAVAYSLTDITAKLTSIEGRNTVDITLSLLESVTANENGELVIDFGDGNKLTKTVNIKDYISEKDKTTEPVSEEETTGGEQTGIIKTIKPVLYLVAVAVVVIIVAFIAIRKKTNKPENPDDGEIKDDKKDNSVFVVPDNKKAEKDNEKFRNKQEAIANKRIEQQVKEEEKQKKLAEKEEKKQIKLAEQEAKKNEKKSTVTFTVAKENTNSRKTEKNRAEEIAQKRAEQKAREDKKAEKTALKEQEKAEKDAQKALKEEQKKKNNTVVFTVAAPSKASKSTKNKADEIAKQRQKQKLAEDKKAEKIAEKEQKKAENAQKRREKEKMKREQSNQFTFYFKD